jgi:hypothetical protein
MAFRTEEVSPQCSRTALREVHEHASCMYTLRLYTLHQRRAEQGKEQFPYAVLPVVPAAY